MGETNILIKPIITEKSMDEAGRGRFTFLVVKDAGKTEIKKAVEEQFKVNAVSVRTLIIKGKRMRVGRKRVKAKGPAFKKAIVTLKEGQRIDLFEIPTKEKHE